MEKMRHFQLLTLSSVDSASAVAVGTPNADGADGDTREINVAGTVTNNGTLDVKYGDDPGAAAIQNTGGSETRPKNIALLPIIKI